MRADEILDLLRGRDAATVRISVRGEAPLVVRAVAYSEGQIVLMAVPEWQFSELNDAMQDLGAAVQKIDTDPANTSFHSLFEPSADRKRWMCKAHGYERKDCPSCLSATVPGWHWGLNEEGRYCNCHCVNNCKDIQDVEPAMRAPKAKEAAADG